MKLYISIDLEGISGIYRWGDEKEDAKRMLRDLKIVLNTLATESIWGEIDSVIISDSHGAGNNLSISDLDIDKVHLIGGHYRHDFMVHGIDDSFDACFFIGYHSMAGGIGAVLDHSYSNKAVDEVKINGRVCGETEINAYMAGYYGVPVIFISGDDKLQGQVLSFYDEGFPYALVKKGISKESSLLFSESLSLNNLVKSTKKAINILNDNQHRKYIRKIENKVSFSVRFKDSIFAYNASILPFVRLTNSNTVEFTLNDYKDSFRLFSALLVLARG